MIKETVIRKLGQSTSLFVIAPVTILAPKWYFNGLFEIVKKQQLQWDDKKACVTLSFDCDFREDVEALPKLLQILSLYSFKTGFACVGKWIEQYPAEHREIIKEGHEIINHTYSHPNNEELGNLKRFNELSKSEQEVEIARCHEVCQHYLNYEPLGFRIPHFGALYTPKVYEILKKLDYIYSSSTVAARSPGAGSPFVTENGILEFPVSPCPEHPFGILDTHHAFRKKHAWHQNSGEFYSLFQELLEIGIQSHAFINLYFDPRDVVLHDDCLRIFDLVRKKREEIHVMSYAEIVRRFSFQQIPA
jgi:hypothetical protein